MILIIVVINAILGYTQEYKAEQSMAALKRMSVPKVRVRRNGQVEEISAVELVPGDVVILETGNIVPADGRVIQSVNLRVEEAALTGESEPVEKDPELVFETDRPLGDRRNMVYSGTLVNYGRGEFVVTEHGHADRTGPHRQHDPGRGAGADAAAAAPRPAGQGAGLGGPGTGGGYRRPGPAARRSPGRSCC